MKTILSIALFLLASFTLGANAETPKPNIIYILADDLGYGDLGCYGQKYTKTPHLDQLCKEGMKFTNHHSGSTVCAPSRACLLTGLHTGHVYVRGNGDYQLRPDDQDITIARLLKNAGYHTAKVGKSGTGCNTEVGHSNAKGFDFFYGFNGHGAAHHYFPPEVYRNSEKITFPNNKKHTGDVYIHDEFMKELTGYLEERKKDSQPFFLHYAALIPHASLVAPEEWVAKYRGKLGKEKPKKKSHYAGVQEPKATFAGMVSRLDWEVGELRKKLDELGLADNTIIFFSSDNGPHTVGGGNPKFFEGSGRFRGFKRSLHEGGVRVPMIAHWPGTIKAGSETDHMSAFWDVMPTLCDITGTETPDHIDGISFLPTLLGNEAEQKQHEYLYWEFYERGGKRAALTKQWKAVQEKMAKGGDPIQLFDIQKDQGETTNVADQHPEVIADFERIFTEAHTPSEHFKLVTTPGAADAAAPVAPAAPVAAAPVAQAAPAERPNIVFVISEDNSKHHLKLFDPTGIATPNIEALAADGVVFESVNSNGPVCSVARSTLLSGCYLPRVGAQFHRKQQAVSMPEGLKPFPYYLKEAGYYTSNAGKTDYNFQIDFQESWSAKGDFTGRDESQPFFYQLSSLAQSHEGKGHFKAGAMAKGDLVEQQASITIPPHHPDTKVMRYSYALYQKKMQTIDESVGKLVTKLKQEGVYDNTIIFYFGDHGGILPRSKGYLYETGLNAPLVIRFPDKWQHLVPFDKGSRTDVNVNFYDFGPSVIHAAGIEVNEKFDGEPFLGEGVSADDLQQRLTYGHADRFDEKYDLVRSVRDGNWKYIRNYQPYNPDGLHSFYRYKSLAYQELRQLHHEGKLNEVQAQFFQKKEPEALYDLATDPYEINNLAKDPAYITTLESLRQKVADRARSLNDLGFFPESTLFAKAEENPERFGKNQSDLIKACIDIADLQLVDYEEAKPQLLAALASDAVLKQQWGIITATYLAMKGQADAELDQAVQNAANAADSETLITEARIAEYLAHREKTNEAVKRLTEAATASEDPIELNYLLNSAAMIDELDREQTFHFSGSKLQVQSPLIKERLKYLSGK